MQQSIEFVNLDFPHHVCKLKKSIYSLKQALRAWLSKLSSKLLALSFYASLSNSSLFIFSTAIVCVYVLIYVDDIVVTASDPSLITDFIASLRTIFPVKDLRFLHFFLKNSSLLHD